MGHGLSLSVVEVGCCGGFRFGEVVIVTSLVVSLSLAETSSLFLEFLLPLVAIVPFALVPLLPWLISTKATSVSPVSTSVLVSSPVAPVAPFFSISASLPSKAREASLCRLFFSFLLGPGSAVLDEDALLAESFAVASLNGVVGFFLGGKLNKAEAVFSLLLLEEEVLEGADLLEEVSYFFAGNLSQKEVHLGRSHQRRDGSWVREGGLSDGSRVVSSGRRSGCCFCFCSLLLLSKYRGNIYSSCSDYYW